MIDMLVDKINRVAFELSLRNGPHSKPDKVLEAVKECVYALETIIADAKSLRDAIREELESGGD